MGAIAVKKARHNLKAGSKSSNKTKLWFLHTLACPAGITYDQSLFARTVVTQFGAVCENAKLRTISSTVYMSGKKSSYKII